MSPSKLYYVIYSWKCTLCHELLQLSKKKNSKNNTAHNTDSSFTKHTTVIFFFKELLTKISYTQPNNEAVFPRWMSSWWILVTSQIAWLCRIKSKELPILWAIGKLINKPFSSIPPYTPQPFKKVPRDFKV